MEEYLNQMKIYTKHLLKSSLDYNLFIYILFILSSTVYSQENYIQGSSQFLSKRQDLSPYEIYKEVTELNKNNNSDKVSRRSDYQFQLDSFHIEKEEEIASTQCDDFGAIYKYDLVNNKQIYFNWDCYNTDDGTWGPDNYTVTKYDENINRLHRYGGDWDGLSYIYPCKDIDWGIFYMYNPSGDISSRSTIIGNQIFIYDTLGLLTTFQEFDIPFGTEDTILRREVFYIYEDEELTTILNYRIDLDGNREIRDSTSLSYYTDGLLERKEFYPFRLSTSTFIYDRLNTYDYYPDGLLFRDRLHRIYDNGNWEVQELFVYTYLDDGSKDYVSIYDDRNPNSPVEIFRSEYEYDSTIPIEDVLMPINPNRTHKSMILSEKHFDIGLYTIPFSLPEEYHASYFYKNYDPVSVSTITRHDVAIEIIPNPAYSQLSILLDGNNGQSIFKILSLEGRILSETKLEKEKRIDINHLNSGTYFYQVIFSDGSITSGKFIKL